MQQYIDLTIDFSNRNDRINGITLDRVTTRSYDTAIKFRIEIVGHTLDDTYDVKILSKYHTSDFKVMTTLGDILEVVDGKIVYTPKVNLITETDYVRNYLYLSKDGLGLDMAQFNYEVDVSQIGEVAVEVKQVYDESYETLLAEFEQALENYKLTLPQASELRAEIDVVLNQFGVDSQQVIGDLVEVTATVEIAEASRVQAETERKEAEILREESYEQKVDTAIVEADVVEKVDNKVTELTPQINNLTAQLAETKSEVERKRKLEDLDPEVLSAIEGGEGTSFNLLSVPQDNSVSAEKLDVDLQKSLISTLKNEVVDPLFEGTRWYPAHSQVEVENGVLTSVGVGSRAHFGVVYPTGAIVIDEGDKVYYSLSVITESDSPNRIAWIIQTLDGKTTLNSVNLDNPITNSLYKLSGVCVPGENINGIELRAFAIYDNAETVQGKKFKIHSPLLVNLTKVFGAGNEPTKKIMDDFLEGLNENAWFKNGASLNEVSLLHFKQISELITKHSSNENQISELITKHSINENRIDELADLISIGSGGTPKRYTLSSPPLPELIEYADLGWTMTGTEIIEPYWIENYEDSVRIIGYYSNMIYQSLDNGATWSRILGGGLISGRPDFVFCTSNPDFNKSVLAVKNGEVFQSTNLNQSSMSTWNKVLDGISAGDLTSRYGRSIHGNIVILSTYHSGYDSTGQNPARFIYLSRDYGETFGEIELPSYMVKDPFQFHVHDVEYDPQLKRVWLSLGDQSNSGLYYSDNFGETWEEIVDAPIRPTNITSLPHVTLFGTDDRPTAIYGYKKFTHSSNELVKWEDFEMLSDPIEDILLIANLNAMDIYSSIDKFPFSLVLPFEGSQSTVYPPTIFCSADGMNWDILLKLDEVDSRFKNALIGRTMGVVSNDPNRTYYIAVYHSEIGNKLIRVRMPEWIEVPSV